MAWIEVARSTNIWDLQSVIGDLELPKGTRMKISMDTLVPWAFNVLGAELAFYPFIPDGMDLVDVYEENGKGVVELEADPAFLVPVLAFIAANWQGILVAGFVLVGIVLTIVVTIKTSSAIFEIPNMIWIIGISVLGFILLRDKIPLLGGGNSR